MLVKIVRTNEKVVRIKVNSDCLEVCANKYASDKKIKSILQDNAEWILQQRNLILLNKSEKVGTQSAQHASGGDFCADKVGIAEIFAGRAFLLCGKTYRVCKSEGAKAYIDGDLLYLPQKYSADKQSRLKALKSYAKRLSEVYLSAEISRFGSSVSLCPTKIEYRDLKNTWLKCSCAAQRIVCLDYRCVALPPKLQRYLIVHAFAHFSNSEHNSAFWNAVSNYLPKYSDIRIGLKDYAFLFDV